MQLYPVNYKFKGSDTNDIEFIAQEVKLIIPEVVVNGKEGSMLYSKMTAILTKVIQEQQATIK